MAANIQPYVKLRDIIFMYSEAAMQSDAQFLRLWRLAFRGFVQMGLNGFWQPKTIQLDVNDNNTLSFPDDYINWIKLGIIADSGELRTFRVNDQIALTNAAYAGVTDLLTSNYYWSGGGVVGLSSGLIQAGGMTVDEANRCFLFNIGFNYSNVTLMYLSSPEQDNDYQLPIQYQEAMISWLAWKDVVHIPATSHFGRGDKLDRAAEFRAQLKLAKRMYKPFRLSEASQAYAEGSFWGIK